MIVQSRCITNQTWDTAFLFGTHITPRSQIKSNLSKVGIVMLMAAHLVLIAKMTEDAGPTPMQLKLKSLHQEASVNRLDAMRDFIATVVSASLTGQ